MSKAGTKAVIFDIGGVIIPLGGLKDLYEFIPDGETLQSIRDKWICSNAVKDFESGIISEFDFAAGITDELGIKLSPGDFLERFRNWPIEVSNRSLELLKKIAKKNLSVTLSNTNHLHWERIEQKLKGIFSAHFPSHITGLIKPDHEAFTNVSKSIGVVPKNIFFFDDTLANVESASKSGFMAHCVKNVDEAAFILTDAGLL